MKYSSLIDNVHAVEWGLSIQEAYLFDWLYSLPSWASETTINGVSYFFASRNKACSELPLITNKPDTMYRHYKSLEEKGLIIMKKVDGQDYVALTSRAKFWNQQSGVSEKNPENPENIPKKSGKKSDILDNKILDNISDNTEAKASDELFPDAVIYKSDPEKKKLKKKKEPDESYQDFKLAWEAAYPILGFDGVSGKKINELIYDTRDILQRQGVPLSRAKMLESFNFVIAYVKRTGHFVDGKPITTFRQQYRSIIKEIIEKKKSTNGKQTSELDEWLRQYYNLSTAR